MRTFCAYIGMLLLTAVPWPRTALGTWTSEQGHHRWTLYIREQGQMDVVFKDLSGETPATFFTQHWYVRQSPRAFCWQTSTSLICQPYHLTADALTIGARHYARAHE